MNRYIAVFVHGDDWAVIDTAERRCLAGSNSGDDAKHIARVLNEDAERRTVVVQDGRMHGGTVQEVVAHINAAERQAEMLGGAL